VIVLPPLLYLAAFVLGVLLHRLFPLALPVAAGARWAGVALVVLGFTTAIAARMLFTRAGTNVNPTQPTTAIVTSGPFRVTRNPMYVSLATILIGSALALRNGWLLVLLIPVLAIMHWGVIRREERYLEKKFGATYLDYRRRVRRYL
jgi:protein-S-isoprenylcysteine O-methyltransferase Ste14